MMPAAPALADVVAQGGLDVDHRAILLGALAVGEADVANLRSGEDLHHVVPVPPGEVGQPPLPLGQEVRTHELSQSRPVVGVPRLLHRAVERGRLRVHRVGRKGRIVLGGLQRRAADLALAARALVPLHRALAAQPGPVEQDGDQHQQDQHPDDGDTARGEEEDPAAAAEAPAASAAAPAAPEARAAAPAPALGHAGQGQPGRRERRRRRERVSGGVISCCATDCRPPGGRAGAGGQ